MKLRRRQKLIQPRLQLRLTGAFLGIATLGVLLQFLLMHVGLMAEAKAIPGAGGMLVDRIPGVTIRALLTTLAVVVPTLGFVGIWLTFRVAGPIHRFETFLKEVAEGRETEPCRLRKGDELQGLCDLLNAATEHGRSLNGEAASSSVTSEAA